MLCLGSIHRDHLGPCVLYWEGCYKTMRTNISWRVRLVGVMVWIQASSFPGWCIGPSCSLVWKQVGIRDPEGKVTRHVGCRIRQLGWMQLYIHVQSTKSTPEIETISSPRSVMRVDVQLVAGHTIIGLGPSGCRASKRGKTLISMGQRKQEELLLHVC